jgi:hypothetical protein
MSLQGRIRATGGEAFQAHAAGFDPRVAFDVDGQSESTQHEKIPALPFINALNRISLIRYVFNAEVLSDSGTSIRSILPSMTAILVSLRSATRVSPIDESPLIVSW